MLIGDNSASATYVKNKHKACEEVGIITKDHKLTSNVTQTELNEIIDDLMLRRIGPSCASRASFTPSLELWEYTELRG